MKTKYYHVSLTVSANAFPAGQFPRDREVGAVLAKAGALLRDTGRPFGDTLHCVTGYNVIDKQNTPMVWVRTPWLRRLLAWLKV